MQEINLNANVQSLNKKKFSAEAILYTFRLLKVHARELASNITSGWKCQELDQGA